MRVPHPPARISKHIIKAIIYKERKGGSNHRERTTRTGQGRGRERAGSGPRQKEGEVATSLIPARDGSLALLRTLPVVVIGLSFGNPRKSVGV